MSMKSKSIVASLLLSACLCGIAAAKTPFPVPTSVSALEFVRARCSTDASEDTLVGWRGAAWTSIPGQAQKHIFDVIGINVIRCMYNESTGWSFTSRELEYYVDPKSGEPIYQWKNFITGETVDVVHVANSPVQFPLGNGSLPATTSTDGEWISIQLDTPLFYPNPLFSNDTFKPYAWQKMYESHEMFQFFVPVAEIKEGKSAPSMHFSWTRVSQFLPWMKMDGNEGRLVFTASGQRTTYADLPAWLIEDIDTRLSLYKGAPPCFEDAPPQTSWTGFAQDLPDYLEGARFPLEAKVDPYKCL